MNNDIFNSQISISLLTKISSTIYKSVVETSTYLISNTMYDMVCIKFHSKSLSKESSVAIFVHMNCQSLFLKRKKVY